MSDEQMEEFGDVGLGGEEEELDATEEMASGNGREGEGFGTENEVRGREECQLIEKGSSAEMSIDRLSSLPDSILIHILFYLNAKEAALTSVLSRRWQFVWTKLTNLEIRETSGGREKIRKFVVRVHRAKDDSGEVDEIAEEIDAQSPIDRLSELPDDILVDILSFLESMKKVATTAVLSKRWRTLWADLPSLKLQDNSKEVEDRGRFVCFVNRALQLRSINNLEALDVKFNFNEFFASDVDGWIDFSVKNRVKDFKLEVFLGTEYTLPQMMYLNPSLQQLKLCRCIVAPLKGIEWKNLTRLHIERVKVPQDVIEEILSCSPVLNNLSLILCWGFNYLDVNCPSLCELTVIELPFFGKNEEMLEILAPSLRFLAISIYKRTRMLKLKNIQSLVGASIDMYRDALIPETMDNNMKELFENIEHVEELKLGLGTSEVLAKLVGRGWRFPGSGLRRLQVKASRDGQSFSAIAHLLDSSPELEELTIDGCERAKDQGPVETIDLARDLLHLETVKIRNFAERNGEPLLTAARILLKRATLLEKMVIEQESFEGSTGFKKTAQTLSGYPRSSRKANLILRH